MHVRLHILKCQLNIAGLQYCVFVCVSTKFVDLMFICAAHAGINNLYIDCRMCVDFMHCFSMFFRLHFVENQY